MDEREEAYQKLVEERSTYLRSYANRTFSATNRDNEAYDRLLDELQCEELETFKDAAKDQARAAVEHFKDDFIFKIRSAIREAYQRQDELNRIISKLDFGKDKYQFVITKNKGPDGKYYKMFMDDSLQIHPASLDDGMENQMNLFTMEHEEQYADLMDELISIFLPPNVFILRYAADRAWRKRHENRFEQNDQEKFRRRRAEPAVCGTSCQLCTDLPD